MTLHKVNINLSFCKTLRSWKCPLSIDHRSCEIISFFFFLAVVFTHFLILGIGTDKCNKVKVLD